MKQLAVLFPLLFACATAPPEPPPEEDSGTTLEDAGSPPSPDAGHASDAGTTDAGPQDAGVDCSGPFIPAQRTLFQQPASVSIANNLVVNPDKPGGAIPPPGSFYVQVVAMGANPMAQSIPWAVGDFTGFYPASPLTAQRGIAADWYGSTAVQLSGADIGMQLHTESIRARGTLERALQTITVLRSFPSTSRPWPASTSELELGLELRVPKWSMVGPSAGYVNLYVLLEDTTHPGLKVWIGGGLSDTRNIALRDFVLIDDAIAQGGTGYVIIHSDLRHGAPYVSPIASNAQRAPWPQLKPFKLRIRAQDLVKGLQQAKTQYGAGFPASLSPADYRLELVALNPEIALVQNLPAYDSWMALSLRSFNGALRPECFDEALYLAAYPDVAAAVRSGSWPSGRVHYDSAGRWEGRTGCGRSPCEFDEALYRACSADARTAPDAWAHYSTVGLAARRLACRP